MKSVLIGGAAMAALILLSAAVSRAGDVVDPVGVVELFTSQGCNSCPPADEVLAELGRRGDVVALGYHVDYWDYLGWGDTLATPENTARQHEYRKAFAKRGVYTPQAVINGRVHVNGAKRTKVLDLLTTLDRDGKGLDVDVQVTRTGDSIVISVGDAAGALGEAHVVLVYFSPAQPVDIGKGENRGRKVVYWNPVTGTQAAGIWHGKAARFELPASEIEKKGEGGFAVLVQSVTADGAPGPILGAAVHGKGTI